MRDKYKNPIVAVLWQDAAYSYNQEMPAGLPNPKLTLGLVVDTTDEFLNIATNVSYDTKTGKFTPTDGFFIPKKAIIEFRKIGNYEK